MHIFHGRSESKRLGMLLIAAILLSCLSFIILWLEYGVLNFGDSDLPPYQPDTLFEKSVDVIWFIVTIGAGLGWLCSIIYVSVLLFRVFKRRGTK